MSTVHLILSPREPVILPESANAWKPARFQRIDYLPEDVAKTEVLYRKVRRLLNKLTLLNFDIIAEQVKSLEINSFERMQGVIDLVFEMAIREPSSSLMPELYAVMCRSLATMQVYGTDSVEATLSNFMELITNQCLLEIEKYSEFELAKIAKDMDMNKDSDPEKKNELELCLEEERRKIRSKATANIRFIAELFKQEMLPKEIIYFCLNHLIQNTDTLPCFCKMLTEIGKELDIGDELNDYFNVMESIVKDSRSLCPRLRFMLQDVIDLRANKWVPRKDERISKTEEEVPGETKVQDSDSSKKEENIPETNDEIPQEAEVKQLDSQVNYLSLNAPGEKE